MLGERQLGQKRENRVPVSSIGQRQGRGESYRVRPGHLLGENGLPAHAMIPNAEQVNPNALYMLSYPKSFDSEPLGASQFTAALAPVQLAPLPRIKSQRPEGTHAITKIVIRKRR